MWFSWEFEEFRFVDRVSKICDFGECGFSVVDFDGLVSAFGRFSVDYFASGYSLRMRLMDKAREEGVQGILVVSEWPRSAL